MAERIPLFIHDSGYADSLDKTADHIPMAGLAIGGATYSAGDIVLNSGVVSGLAAADANGEALSYNQAGAKLNGLNVDSGDLTLSNSATITGLPATPTGATEAVSKAYADNIANNIVFKGHVACRSMVDDSLVTAPTGLGVGDAGKAYVVAGTGGAWSTFAVGDIVEWDGSAWQLLTQNSGGEPPDGTRVIIVSASAAGSFAGDEDKWAEYDATGNTWTATAPEAAETRSVQNPDGDSIYEFLAYTWDDENSEWVLHNGAGQVNAGIGMSKDGNTLNVGAGDGIAGAADLISIDLGTNPGLQLTGTSPDKKLALLLKSANELATDASGLYIVGVPSQFQIGGVATNATVDAAALNTLTGGGNADTEHVHAHSSMTGQTENDHHNRSHAVDSASDHSVSGETVGHVLTITGTGDTFGWQALAGVDEAKRVENAFTAGEAIAKGDPVYFSSTEDDTILKGAANNSTKFRVRGLALAAYADDDPAEMVSHGLAEGLITGMGFTRGQLIYLDATGGLTTTFPAAQNYVVIVGTAVNADDLYVDIEVIGRNPA